MKFLFGNWRGLGTSGMGTWMTMMIIPVIVMMKMRPDLEKLAGPEV